MLTAAQKASLLALLPAGRVFTDPASRLAYEQDGGSFTGMPDAVVILESTPEAQQLACWSAANGVNLVGRGAGTGLTGGAVASEGGVVVSFSRLNRILDVDIDSRLAIVQPGLVNQVLQQRLAPCGLIYPPDPASYAVSTIGGNVAENAGGPHCLKYGVTNNYVQGLEIVLPDGRCVWLGGQAVDFPEFDLTSLVTGSEGTLALITQVVLRLRRPAAQVKTLTASFAEMAVAGQAVSAVIAAGLAPATIELMDHNMINIVEDYLGLGLLRQAAALLIFDVEGYPESLDVQLDDVAEILRRHAPLEVKIARTTEERERLWLGRRNASGATARISPSEYVLDVCLPRSRLAEALVEINAIGARYQLPVAYLAHAGDGNLHPGLLCDLSKEDDRRRVHQASEEILCYCAQIGGSIGGEHGIGIEKRLAMTAMYGPGELSAMLQVKQAFDPQDRFNPGKIFPAELPPSEPASETAGVTPANPFEPRSAEETAAGLRAFQAGGQVVRLAGGGRHWQGSAGSGVALSTRRLSGIVSLSADDFYVTVRAGTTLGELQAALAEGGFWLAVSSPWTDGTLGGLIAANTNGPLRVLYGALRDQLLAVQVALADGRLLRFGRPLVKDVAGYQMNKLLCGSFGALGVLTEVTLKIVSQPMARQTFVIRFADPFEACAAGLQVMRLATICSGVVLAHGVPEDRNAPGYSLIVTLEGHPLDVNAELAMMHKTLAGRGELSRLEPPDVSASQVWVERLAGQAFHVRAAVPPAQMAGLLQRRPADDLDQNWAADVANGVLVWGANLEDMNRAGQRLTELRLAADALGGYAIMAAGRRGWLGRIAAWGNPRPAYDLMRNLKLRWDPADLLNRGEFI